MVVFIYLNIHTHTNTHRHKQTHAHTDTHLTIIIKEKRIINLRARETWEELGRSDAITL